MMEILTAKQMYDADNATIKSGITSDSLMENAGAAVVNEIMKHFAKRNVLVLCGPGNNGGDGFVIARLLKEAGWDVKLASLNGEQGDWDGEFVTFNKSSLDNIDLVVDAIFGIGLSRKIEGSAAHLIKEINQQIIDTVSVDIPSGINSDTGEIMGEACEAKYTITFARKKIGHLLYPGRRCCGETIVADIGIEEEPIKSDIFENTPDLWLNDFPFPKEEQHKYDRGHSVIVGGGVRCTGAASLAAISALTAGSGLVTITCPKNALMVYATKLTSVMNKGISDKDEFFAFINNPKINTVLVGPGNGVTEQTRQYALTALGLAKTCVIDADAITCFKNDPEILFRSTKAPTILTPHEGEFSRIFTVEGSKVERTLAAAKQANAIIVYKGADTIIAAPDGRIAINTNAPPTLATAGSGDVLAGIITGLLANDMEPFKAACAAVWMHGETANIAGMGLISEILPKLLPQVMQGLYEGS